MPTLDLDGLRAFAEVAQRLSFFEAAQALSLSPSALTRRVKRVEAALQFELFERTTRHVALSAAGRELLPRAQAALLAFNDCVDWAEASSRAGAQQLTIACVPSIARTLLPRLVSDFTQQRSDVRIRIVESHVAQLVRQIYDGEVDLGIGFMPSNYPGLLLDELMVDPYDLACPLDHTLARGARVRWADLREQPLIVSGSGRHSGNRKVLDDALVGLAWAPTRLVEIEHLSTALGLVEAGLGITIVPRSALTPELRQRLAIRPLEAPVVTRTLGVLRRRGRTLTPAARQFRLVLRRMAPIVLDVA
jgi:DNA-binding transcriptional LysR family regulator